MLWDGYSRYRGPDMPNICTRWERTQIAKYYIIYKHMCEYKQFFILPYSKHHMALVENKDLSIWTKTHCFGWKSKCVAHYHHLRTWSVAKKGTKLSFLPKKKLCKTVNRSTRTLRHTTGVRPEARTRRTTARNQQTHRQTRVSGARQSKNNKKTQSK